jgi:hypothetical protein
VYPEDMPYGCTLQQINCHDSKYRGSFGFPRLNGDRKFKKKMIKVSSKCLQDTLMLLKNNNLLLNTPPWSSI